MKRNRKESKRRPQTIQVWTYEQAMEVLPYVASVMTSLREHQLEVIRHQLKASRLDKKEGRLTRSELITYEETVNAGRQADERLQESLEELHTLDVYCLDPIQGTALIPFAQGDDLAWFVYDMFDPGALRYWRYHRDPIETRRPLADRPATPAGDDSMVI